MTTTDNIGYPSHYDDSAERTLGLPSWFDLGNVGWGAQGEPVATDAVLAALDCESFYAATGRAVPSTSADILRDLAAASLIRLRPLGRWSVTDLGVICFARDLLASERLGPKALRIVRHAGTDTAAVASDVRIREGYVRSLPTAIALVEQLTRNEGNGPSLKSAGAWPPATVVRDLIVNAAIHQDFSVAGVGPTVEVFDDRIEFSSPGAPLIETERLLDAPPRSRNEDLASLLRGIGFCEERGSGIDRVAAACEAEYLPAPDFRVVNARTVATVFRRRSFASLTQHERSHAAYLHACLRYANHTTVTAATIRERFGLRDRAMVSRIIADSITAGLIRLADPAGGGKPAAYVPHWA
jgi:ATP-dependent DNA helicase RecG